MKYADLKKACRHREGRLCNTLFTVLSTSSRERVRRVSGTLPERSSPGEGSWYRSVCLHQIWQPHQHDAENDDDNHQLNKRKATAALFSSHGVSFCGLSIWKQHVYARITRSQQLWRGIRAESVTAGSSYSTLMGTAVAPEEAAHAAPGVTVTVAPTAREPAVKSIGAIAVTQVLAVATAALANAAVPG